MKRSNEKEKKKQQEKKDQEEQKEIEEKITRNKIWRGVRRRRKNNNQNKWRGAIRKKTKTTKRKISKKVDEGRNAMKKWEFISTNIKLHPTNKTHQRFHQTNALVGVGSF